MPQPWPLPLPWAGAPPQAPSSKASPLQGCLPHPLGPLGTLWLGGGAAKRPSVGLGAWALLQIGIFILFWHPRAAYVSIDPSNVHFCLQMTKIWSLQGAGHPKGATLAELNQSTPTSQPPTRLGECFTALIQPTQPLPRLWAAHGASWTTWTSWTT
jgi:hypothetical protein